MNTFINDFKNSMYYDQIIHQYDKTVLAYIGGSRCHNLDTQYSDYDITILIDQDIPYYTPIRYHYLMYKGVKVHWYYVPLSQIFSSELGGIYDMMCVPTLYSVVRNNERNLIIYENSLYKEVISFLFQLLPEIETAVYARAGLMYKESVDNYAKGLKHISDREYSSAKFLYFMCFVCHRLVGTEFDKQNMIELKCAKATKYISDSCSNYTIDRLKELSIFLDSYTEDFKFILEQAQYKFNEEVRRLSNNV